MWSAGIRDGPGDITNNHYTYHGNFKNNRPQGPGKISFPGCEQFGEYVLTDVFTRRNGILETEQESTWRCTELIQSVPKELPEHKQFELTSKE